jgi:outer membrane protein TolC
MTITTRWARAAAILLGCLSLPAVLQSQRPQSLRDTLKLGTLQDEAVTHDPRGRQLQLLADQAKLRLESIRTDRLPALSVNGQAQYQSDVASIPIMLPGVSIPMPPRDTYDAHLEARQKLFDPSLGGRRGVERAQLAASQAGVRVALHAVRQSVNDAYFQVLEIQARQLEADFQVQDLSAQLDVARKRVKEGAALESEAETIEAALLRKQQSLRDLSVQRSSAVLILSDLTGRAADLIGPLEIGDHSAEIAQARTRLATLHARPEFEQFTRNREVLEQQSAAASDADLPRVSAFGRAGYGRPGLNPLAKDFDSYWLAGLMLEWTPWNWGSTRRDRQVLQLQQDIIDTEQASFAESIKRSVDADLSTIDRLEASLSEDDRIIALREAIFSETQHRFAEGVITSAEYVDRQADLAASHMMRSEHRIELERVRVHFLTSLGLEVR